MMTILLLGLVVELINTTGVGDATTVDVVNTKLTQIVHTYI